MHTENLEPSLSIRPNLSGEGQTLGTRRKLELSLTEGRASFATSKSASSYAVSHSAIVALFAAPASAPQHLRKWLREGLAKANDQVDAKNKQRKEDRKKGLASLKGAVTTETLAAEGAENPAAELARLRALAELDDEEFRAGQLTKLKKYQDSETVDSTAVIRFVFELYARSDAPLVSRYAKVLDWIKARFEHEGHIDVETIVDALKAHGGFEAVLRAQRQLSGSSEGSGDQGQGKGQGNGEGTNRQPAEAKPEQAFHAETHTVTMRLPPALELFEGRLLSLHVICWGPDEIEIVAYQPLTEAELEELKAQVEAEITPAIPEGQDAPTVPMTPDDEQVEGETID